VDVTPTLEASPLIINDRTMVPIRVISEYLGAEVGWEPETSTVVISSRGRVNDGNNYMPNVPNVNNQQDAQDNNYEPSSPESIITPNEPSDFNNNDSPSQTMPDPQTD
jgi:hypothetical protein